MAADTDTVTAVQVVSPADAEHDTLVLRKTAVPSPSPDQVRVEVRAAGVNPKNSEGVVEPRGSVPHHFHGHDHVSVIDTTDPARLDLIALFPRPLPPPGAGYQDFLDRPGWSGPHNQSQLHHNPDVAAQGHLVYLTYFNAGLRIYDVHEPRQPTEVAWFLPRIRLRDTDPCPRRNWSPKPRTCSSTAADSAI